MLITWNKLNIKYKLFIVVGSLLVFTVITIASLLINEMSANSRQLFGVVQKQNESVKDGQSKTLADIEQNIKSFFVTLENNVKITFNSLKEKQGEVAQNSLKIKLNGLSGMVARMAGNAISNFDFDSLNAFCEDATKDPDILLMYIIDASGSTLTTYIPENKEKLTKLGADKIDNVDDLAKTIEKEKGLLKLETEIKHKDTLIGKVVTFAHTDSIQAQEEAIEQDVEKAVLSFKEDMTKTENLLDAEFTGLQGTVNKQFVQLQEKLEKDSMTFMAQSIGMSVTLGLVLISGVLTLLMILISHTISNPIKKIAHALKNISDGNLDIEIPGKNREDEIGEISTAVEVFRNNQEKIKTMEEERKIAEKRNEEDKIREINTLADHFEETVEGVVQNVLTSIHEMGSLADSLRKISTEVTNQSSSASTATLHAASNVETAFKSTKELATSISEIRQKVENSAEIAKIAVSEANKADTMMGTLSQAAGQIGSVASIISDIADQTNLLALNATIEAARAGEAGKGFAVVASEVKNLASQTVSATDEINKLISSVQQATEHSVEAIHSVGQIIEKINNISTDVSTSVDHQNSATMGIADNIETVSTETKNVTNSVGIAANAASEAETLVSHFVELVETLSTHSEKLKESVDGFLGNIRNRHAIN
ncbi:MAG: methyl-accepting chemotaxis protein [Alphaproteobacteria bacterium]|jgi:methyl-accepting chemotaxis protein|nr:methyl-accepting chemotaxis protein [Alphaproteobacteria bacterium]